MKHRSEPVIPMRAFLNRRLSKLDLACLAAIAVHDRMSQRRGNGPGCYAASKTLAAEAGTDPTNFSKALSKLVRFGYVLREPQLMDKRRFTLRVNYDDPAQPDAPPDDEPDPEIVGEMTNNNLGDSWSNAPKVVGNADCETVDFSSENDPKYIPLKGEMYSVETEKCIPLNGTSLRDSALPPSSDPLESPSFGHEEEGADAPAGRGISLVPHLPRHFANLAIPAILVRLEEAFNIIGRNADALNSRERENWIEFLTAASEEFYGEPTGYQAERLLFEMAFD